MRHIYFINLSNRGATFGVRTYINQLLSLLRNEVFTFHLVQLNSDRIEVSKETIDGVEYIFFPNPLLIPENEIDLGSYHTNVIRLLGSYIDATADNIFHLNYLSSLTLAKSINEYLGGKVILTIHYSQSIFNLKGDISKFFKILEEPDKENVSQLHNAVHTEVNQVRQMIHYFVDRVISVAHHSYQLNNVIYQIPNEKSILIYNSLVDSFSASTSSAAIRKKLGIDLEEKIIVFAGRLDEIKGLQCLLQALTILKKKGNKFHLFIAGKGEYNAALDFVQGLLTNITFTGLLEKDKLYDIFSIADIGVVPSLYEEFGYVTLEMMMCKLPVVAFNTTGSAEIINNYSTGLLAELLFDQADISIQNLADKIEYLLINPEKSRQMGNAGRERFLTNFSAILFKEKMTTLYSSV